MQITLELIAQALLGQSQLLIVDEPTSGLDPEERVRLRNLLSDMAGRCTVILSTHIIEDISQSCNTMAVINQGKVIFVADPHELIRNVQGKVWFINTNGEQPVGNVVIISSMQLQGGTQYRILAEQKGEYPGTQAEPTLEDGYIWLMNQTRLEQATAE